MYKLKPTDRIVPITHVEFNKLQINSIQTKHKSKRQDSKPITFLLTYQGTYIGLMENCGFDEPTAKNIEKSYHELYKVSTQWVQDHINKAVVNGYVTCAFGLRVRTPLLAKTVLNIKATPYEAQAEARTAGNALGQSWGLLNNRAAIELSERLKNTPYLTKILPIMHIHDAQYFLIDDDVDTFNWLNINLVECMEWQGLPEIYHPEVKLGGELSIFYPDWSKELTIPNKASKETIIKLCKEFVQ
jgi:DNA polymerase-1